MTVKTILLIVGGVVVIGVAGAIAAPLIIGNAINTSLKEATGGSMSYDSNQFQVTGGDENISMQIGGNLSMPADWPSDVPGVYSNGKLQSVIAPTPNSKDIGGAVTYRISGVTSSTLTQYYVSQATNLGWRQDLNNYGPNTLAFTKGNLFLTVTMSQLGSNELAVNLIFGKQ